MIHSIVIISVFHFQLIIFRKMAALARALPAPLHTSTTEYEEAPAPLPAAPGPQLPKYGQRKGWKPKTATDFNGGGAYPECHVAQYPLDMGKKNKGQGSTLALQVDQDGLVRYDAIAQHGRAPGSRVQSSFKDLVPLANRTDVTESERQMERPDDLSVAETAERTRLALERITHGKIKAAQPKHVPKTNNDSTYVRYTPANQSANEGKQRIIKMTEVQEDPLEPPRFKHKKIPRGPAEPPPPVLQSPPRAATAQDQKDWMIPPCISNWKNNKGYTIPLDKRLAADGRGLQDVHINDNFAKFSESLYIADRHIREEVRARAQLQQLLAQKQKISKEEELRLLAQRAREDRSGLSTSISGSVAAASGSRLPVETGINLGGYGSESGSEESEEEDEDEEAIRERNIVREEKRREREKEMRMSNMGSEMRAKMLAKEANRDISEKIALGLAKPSTSKETLLDSRLFNREALSTGFASEDSYNLYDKPLFAGSSAAAAIYRPAGSSRNDESFGGGTEEGIKEEMSKDRFQLGNATRGFEGAEGTEAREGPVQFEKDTIVALDGSADPFGVEQFMDAARRGGKRIAEDRDEERRKRARDE
ncbi:Nuclear receptor coactivator, putative [Cryptococcus gattii WM276]|uniref:Pre-mRNA-processing protein 45 n=2 Tax=Cryptococcus gattii TaxID=37769 RepID=E6REL3_CRYGW|nr:Nuclear receptor coactivator, putative [Cryptococcus gattii WM276]ADV25135.1 Nuclear receptor coactivator, putative [Cryptococcus gattii WM276]KIR76673.1 pre-mRNA-processing protein 45 [Cryptococcus gattii EJB2]